MNEIVNQYLPVFIYSMALNTFTFAIFGYDKWIAGGRVRRVPEKVLLLLCLLGGSVGGLVGMYTFRHKTRKVSFQFWLVGILVLQAGLILGGLTVWKAS